MVLISHRGNINGKNESFENSVPYIKKALDLGYNVEVDVWFTDGFYLGHDEPKYKIDVGFLQRKELWCHAKNLEALAEMKKYSNIHCFWHQNDDYLFGLSLKNPYIMIVYVSYQNWGMMMI